MALIEFKLNEGRQRCMGALLAVMWLVLSSNPFDPGHLVHPSTILPVVCMNICIVSWTTYACTRTCEHTSTSKTTIAWSMLVLLIVGVLVFGGAPAFGLVAALLGPVRVIAGEKHKLAQILCISSSLAVAAGCLMVADPRHVNSPGGYAAFKVADTTHFTTIVSYVCTPVIAVLSHSIPLDSNPTQLMAHSSTLVLIVVGTLGFMTNMTSLDDTDSLANVNFYHTCFILAWSAVIAVALQLLLVFHVMGRAFDAYCLMALTTLVVPVLQKVATNKAPSGVQACGIATLLVAAGVFVQFMRYDDGNSTRAGQELYTCQACEADEREQLAAAMEIEDEQDAI
jgi:hypothetical protein